jgi:enamine deaminase RidA (YjgF/YER057c/UK114 family)
MKGVHCEEKSIPSFRGRKKDALGRFVVAGNTVYISGKNGRDPETGNAVLDTIEGQTWWVLE